MNKNVKVILLYKNDINAPIWSKEKNRELVFKRTTGSILNGPKHLYLISDEETKEGDWVYNQQNGNIYQLNNKYSKINVEYESKIIATTDSLLELECQSCRFKKQDSDKSKYICSCISLPQIPESFIKAYIKAYNEGNLITEVDLEYNLRRKSDGCQFTLQSNGLFQAHDEHGWETLDVEDGYIEIKTRPDNTVIVHQSKTYTKEEVIKLLKEFKNDCEMFSNSSFKKKHRNLNYDELEAKWIEENL